MLCIEKVKGLTHKEGDLVKVVVNRQKDNLSVTVNKSLNICSFTK